MLGIPVNASAKDLAANKSKMILLDIGKDVSFPLDLPDLLQSINRTKETVANAEREINLPQDKIKHALFWFAQPTEPIGKLAYDHLLQGNSEKALELFSKSHSWEALLCRSILELQVGKYGEALLDFYSITNGLYSQMCHAIAGQTFEMSASDLIKLYLQTLTEEVEASTLLQEWGKDTVLPGGSEIIEFELRDIAIEKPLDIIEKEIVVCKAISTDNAEAQLDAGKKLANNTHKVRIQLQKLVGSDDPRYSRLVDKLANQIMQCSINYFNKIDGENREIIENALKLGEYAIKIAVGKMARDHIQHNVDILRKKKEKLPPAEIEEHDTAIKAKIVENILLKGRTIDSAIQLMKDCAPHIVAIKEHLELRQYYLNISTQIVNAALSSVIEEYNNVSEQLSSKLQTQLYKDSAIMTLKNLLKKAWKATLMMDMFDKEDVFKSGRYADNRKALEEMYENVFGLYSAPSRIGYDELDLRTEEEVFSSCKSSSDYRGYMSRYPCGKHLIEANRKYQQLLAEEEIKRKEKEEKERKSRIEREAEDRVFKSCTSISDFEAYLRQYPSGHNKWAAESKIKELKEKNKSIGCTVAIVAWIVAGGIAGAVIGESVGGFFIGCLIAFGLIAKAL